MDQGNGILENLGREVRFITPAGSSLQDAPSAK